MISSNDGFIYINNWEEHQNTDKLAEIREQTRKRVAKCREKKLLSQGSVTSNVTVTLGNAIEEEKEEDKEKESHSFIRSDAQREDFSSDALQLKYLGGTLGQGILLISDEQFSDLCDKLSLDEIDKYCSIIVECEKNGKKYKRKSHYQAILDMATKDRRIKP